MQRQRHYKLQRLHHCSHRPPSIDPGSGQQRGGNREYKGRDNYTTKAPPLQPQPPSIDTGSGQWKVAQRMQRQRCYDYKAHHCSHRPPFHKDPGLVSGEWHRECKGRGMSARRCTGKQWWRLAMRHTQHWVGQRQQQTPESCCSTTRQMRIKYWM